MGGRREVSILSHRPVTSSDLKQERLFFHECLNIFATGCSYPLDISDQITSQWITRLVSLTLSHWIVGASVGKRL